MKRTKTVIVVAVCALCLSSAKAALLLDWQGNMPSGSPSAGISGSPDIVAYQSGIDGVSALNAQGVDSSGSVSGADAKPGVAFAAMGAQEDNAGAGFTTTSSDIQFTAAEITPVPEPINYALTFFALAFVLGGAGRFYLGRLRET